MLTAINICLLTNQCLLLLLMFAESCHEAKILDQLCFAKVPTTGLIRLLQINSVFPVGWTCENLASQPKKKNKAPGKNKG